MFKYKFSLGMTFAGFLVLMVCLLNIDAEIPVIIFAGSYILTVVGLVLFFRQLWRDHKEQKEKDDAIERQKKAEQAENERKEQMSKQNGTWPLPLEQLEKAFKDNNVNDILSERNYQKAKLLVEDILRKEGIPPEYHASYLTREKMAIHISRVDDARDAQEKEELRIRKSHLRREEAECKYYSKFIGRDKSIRYCRDQIEYYTDIIKKCEANEASVRQGGNRLYELSKGRESSWAIHGGIASGIAGGAAGLAVAADVQRKNAQIQQQNANLAHSIAEFQVNVLQGIWKEKREAEEHLELWKANEEQAKLQLIQELDEKELLAYIQPRVMSAENDLAGAVKINVAFHSSSGLCIYGSEPACVDGSIRVLLSVSGKVVGSAICVIRYGGVRCTQVETCICTNIEEMADEYEFSFEPYHLWAVEKN